MNKKIFLRSLINAIGTFVYTALVALFFFNVNKIFGSANTPDKNFTAPLFMLTIFIISATVTGFLVLGKPIQLYLENKKKEGVLMLFITVAWLVIFAAITLITLVK